MKTGKKESGTILVPCICLLGLASVLALGMLRVGGVETIITATLSERAKARQAGLSGIEIAYRRLSENLDYEGEECALFDGSSCAVDIAVSSLGDGDFEISVAGTSGCAESVFRTRAAAKQSFWAYPLYVGDDLVMSGPDPQILSDCYVGGIVWAKCGGYLAGDLFLPGDREVLYNGQGEPVSIDGYNIPTLGGEVHANVNPMVFPETVLDQFRAMAEEVGHYYTGNNTRFTNETMEGVVFVGGCNSLNIKDDVTILGLLVCEGVSKIHVQKGHFRVSCDNTLSPYTAILAPDALLHVNPNANIDVYGLVLVGESKFHGNGSFTGPLFIAGDLNTYPHSVLCCQCPLFMSEYIYDGLVWEKYEIVETAYEEL